MAAQEPNEPTDPDSVGEGAADALGAEETSPADAAPVTGWAGRARGRRDGPQQTRRRRRR